jgi:hypothetical protein
MIKALCILLLIPSLSFSQPYSREDIEGAWKIERCDIFENNTSVKSFFLDEESGSLQPVYQGKYIGRLDAEINNALQTIMGTSISFNDDSTVVWDAALPYINFSKAYWQLIDSSEIIFCEWKNRKRVRPLLLECKIVTIQGNRLFLNLFELGLEMKVVLKKE